MFLYKCRFDGGSGVPYHVSRWPHSLVSQYVAASSSSCDPDYGIMTQIIRDQPVQESNFPGRDVAVVHVRVGDVVEIANNLAWAVSDCPDGWNLTAFFDGEPVYKAAWRAVLERYVMKRTFYEDHIQTLRRNGVRKVVLVAGSHRDYHAFTRSSMYIDLVRDVFRSRGFDVAARFGQAPDDDVIFLAHAHWLIQSGGGFSALTGTLCRHMGGTVLCSTPHYVCDPTNGRGHVVV